VRTIDITLSAEGKTAITYSETIGNGDPAAVELSFQLPVGSLNDLDYCCLVFRTDTEHRADFQSDRVYPCRRPCRAVRPGEALALIAESRIRMTLPAEVTAEDRVLVRAEGMKLGIGIPKRELLTPEILIVPTALTAGNGLGNWPRRERIIPRATG